MMDDDFENNDDYEDSRLSELEIRTMDLENELRDLLELRESFTREQAEIRDEQDEARRRTMLRAAPRPRSGNGPGRPAPSRNGRSHDPQPYQARRSKAQPYEPARYDPQAFDAAPYDPETYDPETYDPAPHDSEPYEPQPRGPRPHEALHHLIEDFPQDQEIPAAVISTGPRPHRGGAHGEASRGRDRTQTLIDRGRRSAAKRQMPRFRTIILVVATIVIAIVAMLAFGPSPSWPASVATVKSEITQACLNPNVASEPGQLNFACGQDTSQILWVFALLTSNDNPSFTDAKTGRQGLEPITPTQGGEIAWSLDLHHPYNPADPVDSLAVAARAINNIIGGATLTSAAGKPSVQPGLESSPANCARYTGSAAVVSRAGFPAICAHPITTAAGQAALVSDTYEQWVVGATSAAAYDVSVLFENASNPGNAQVQAILKSLPGAI